VKKTFKLIINIFLDLRRIDMQKCVVNMWLIILTLHVQTCNTLRYRLKVCKAAGCSSRRIQNYRDKIRIIPTYNVTKRCFQPCTLDSSQMFILFNTLWSEFFLCILQNVITVMTMYFHISLKNVLLIYHLWFCSWQICRSCTYIYRVYTKEWCGFNSENYWIRTILLCIPCTYVL
jgi:hypothetical protein